MQKKINIILTAIIIVSLIAIIFILYKLFLEYKDWHPDTNAQDIIEYFDDNIPTIDEQSLDEANDNTDQLIQPEINYKNYRIIGKITIPKINISYPILAESNVKNLRVSVTKQWGVNPNEYGLIVIAGHNMYDNSTLFSNLNRLKINDTIIITDVYNRTIHYYVYSVYETEPTDTSHLTNDESIREVILTTCNFNGTKRLIVKCREK